MLSSIRARVLATCVAIVAAALVGAMTNAAFKHILMVRDALTDVSGGSGDLTKRLPADGADEAAQIAGAFNAFAEKIEGGSGLVQTAGATMDEIVDGVRNITSVIAEISVAAKEQSTGLEQVNQAVSQLDDTTQQNAALVEQSAAAATSLREQAARLAQTVGEFKLAERAVAA